MQTSNSYRGVDCASRLNAERAAKAKAAGYDFVGRYLVPQSYGKALTKAEAETLTGAGLRILTVWELYETRARDGSASGRADGAKARECAKAVGMPEGGVIYFAVDYNAPEGDLDAIAAYLRAAASAAAPYKAGVYGSRRVVEAMAAGGVCRFFWQCCAWSSGRSPVLSVYQSDWAGTAAARAAAALIGVSVDLNECPDMARAGIWNYESEEEDMQRFNTIAELPEWARPTATKLVDGGVIRGRGGAKDENNRPADLDLTEDMLRQLVWNDRAGAYDKLAEALQGD